MRDSICYPWLIRNGSLCRVAPVKTRMVFRDDCRTSAPYLVFVPGGPNVTFWDIWVIACFYLKLKAIPILTNTDVLNDRF